MRTDAAPVVFLMGPTGSGKSRLAVALARMYDVEIVSVDSAQIYRGLDLGTAKPHPALRARIPHHLIDICAPTEAYSAARFRADATAALAGIAARGRVALLVGGTGLYFRALEHGLAPLPAADPAVRATLRDELARDGAAALHARLAMLDPAAAARIHPRDPQRLLRALEVHALSGRRMSELWQARALPGLTAPVVKVALAPVARSALHASLAARFRDMLERGLVNEVRALARSHALTAHSPAMRSVGYREVWRYLAGELDWAGLLERGITATRQLAKRQLTWLRREPDCVWFDAASPDLPRQVAALLAARGIVNGRGVGLE